MKKLLCLMTFGFALFSMSGAYAASHAGAPMKSGDSSCEAKAAEKKLNGAAKTSFLKKCNADNSPAAACEKSAADKKLHGAAKKSHVKKCMEDSKPAAEAKPAETKAAEAKPAASAKK
ncbi:hypothetical protein [Caenimonas koreensis]|nr:hypothetical protein [Caenimonas koreensis]